MPTFAQDNNSENVDMDMNGNETETTPELETSSSSSSSSFSSSLASNSDDSIPNEHMFVEDNKDTETLDDINLNLRPVGKRCHKSMAERRRWRLPTPNNDVMIGPQLPTFGEPSTVPSNHRLEVRSFIEQGDHDESEVARARPSTASVAAINIRRSSDEDLVDQLGLELSAKMMETQCGHHHHHHHHRLHYHQRSSSAHNIIESLDLEAAGLVHNACCCAHNHRHKRGLRRPSLCYLYNVV